MSYYSLVSSLPILNLDFSECMTKEEFISSCSCHLNNKEMSIIINLLNNKKISKNKFLDKYYNLETQINNSILKIRCQKYNTESKQLINQHEGYSGSIDNALIKHILLIILY